MEFYFYITLVDGAFGRVLHGVAFLVILRFSRVLLTDTEWLLVCRSSELLATMSSVGFCYNFCDTGRNTRFFHRFCRRALLDFDLL